MTLLVQTDGHVKRRKARRKAARANLVDDLVIDAENEALADLKMNVFRTPGSGAQEFAIAAFEPQHSAGSGGAGSSASTVFQSAVISEISVLLRGLVACAATVMEEEQQNLQAALLEESKKAMHKLANRLTAQIQEQQDEGPEDELPPDGTLEKLRRLVPSEVLVAWASWTAAVRMLGTATLPPFVQWIVWGVYGLASFVYVLVLKFQARDAEERRDGVHGQAGDKRKGGQQDTVNEDGTRPEEVTDAPQDAGSSSGPQATSDAPSQPVAEGRGDADTAVQLPCTNQAGEGGRYNDRRPARHDKSPTNTQLVSQAVLSTLAFLLLSAVTGDIYLEEVVLKWVLLGVTPLFALFAQFAVHDSGDSV